MPVEEVKIVGKMSHETSFHIASHQHHTRKTMRENAHAKMKGMAYEHEKGH